MCRLKNEKMERKYSIKRGRINILISDNIDESKTVTRDSIMIKGSAHPVDIIVNTYPYNFKVPAHIKQTLRDHKRVIENNTIRQWDLIPPCQQ